MKNITKQARNFDVVLLAGVVLTLGGCANAIIEPPTLALGLTTMALLLLRLNKKN